LIFLTLAVTLPEFPALAMKALACQPMAALSTIQLRENAAAITRLVDEGQQMDLLWMLMLAFPFPAPLVNVSKDHQGFY
jgi:hypothetical protein